ncbi:MAG: hypothetical protein KME40_27715 [Komarekiella atlantica HA4396-MV6]|jgi:hypothetical protein|nr:hypothetical protein [Komarekiella atlantica HA4396-MV6]
MALVCELPKVTLLYEMLRERSHDVMRKVPRQWLRGYMRIAKFIQPLRFEVSLIPIAPYPQRGP